jgi:aminoglycoside 2''-phosphotransferase
MPDNAEAIAEFLRSRILKYFPDLNIENSVLIESGWDNHVLIINNEIVFRFPKNSIQVSKLLTEMRLLRSLKDFPFEIPDYSYLVNEGDVFGGYRLIHGNPLNSVKKLSDSLLEDFGILFSYLWSIKPEKYSEIGVPIHSPVTWLKHLNGLISTFSDSLNRFIPADFFRSLKDLSADILSDMDEKNLRLIHGDLYRENVRITDSGNHITGIIDWSDASFGDVALDIAAVSIDFDLTDLFPILRRFNGLLNENIARRIRLYQIIEPLYAADYFLDVGDIEEVSRRCRIITDKWMDDMKFRNIYNINDVKDLWHTKQR